MEGLDQVRRGMTTYINQGRGLITGIVEEKGIETATSQGKYLGEATEGRITSDLGRGMNTKKGVRIITAKEITIHETIFQGRKGKKIDTRPKDMKEKRKVRKEMEIGLPHASSVVNLAIMQGTVGRRLKTLTTLKGRSFLLERRNNERLSWPRRRTGSLNLILMMMVKLGMLA